MTYFSFSPLSHETRWFGSKDQGHRCTTTRLQEQTLKANSSRQGIVISANVNSGFLFSSSGQHAPIARCS